MKDKDKKETSSFKLPKCVYFLILFGCSFLPGLWGKMSAALAGMIFTLYLLSLMQGIKRYVLAIVLPIITCIAVRLASSCIYGWIVDVQARQEAISKVYVLKDSLFHYCQRLFETVLCSKDAVSGFCKNWEFQSLYPLVECSQFILILIIMGVCMVTVFRDKELS